MWWGLSVIKTKITCLVCHLILVLVLSQWLNFGLLILALSALEYKFRKVVFESDSSDFQAVLSLILKGVEEVVFACWFLKITGCVRDLSSYKVQHIFRKANQVADAFAKFDLWLSESFLLFLTLCRKPCWLIVIW